MFCYDTMTLVGPGQLGSDPRRRRLRPDRSLAGRVRPASGVRAVPSAGPPRRASRLWRFVLPEQRGGRGAGPAARLASAASRCWTSTLITATARRRSSTTGRTSSTAACTLTPAPAGSRITWVSPPSAGVAQAKGANRNMPLAPGSGDEAWLTRSTRLCDGRPRACAGCDRPVARGGRGGRRPGEPAAGDGRRLPRGGRAHRPARPGRRDPGGRLRPALAWRVRAAAYARGRPVAARRPAPLQLRDRAAPRADAAAMNACSRWPRPPCGARLTSAAA